MKAQSRINIGWRGFALTLGLVLGSLHGSAAAQIAVTARSEAGEESDLIAGASGEFEFSLPLRRNSLNRIVVTAVDAHGNHASKELSVTQISLDAIVVSQVVTERLSPQEVKRLVAEGVIDLDHPDNYNVSRFSIILTIDEVPVRVVIPVVSPKDEPSGGETIPLPFGLGSGGGRPRPRPMEIIFFEEMVPSEPGLPAAPPIPGVLLIDGAIKSLKEFFKVRLILLNTSGIFTLRDVNASVSFPDGGLTPVLPAGGRPAWATSSPATATPPAKAPRSSSSEATRSGCGASAWISAARWGDPAFPPTGRFPSTGARWRSSR